MRITLNYKRGNQTMLTRTGRSLKISVKSGKGQANQTVSTKKAMDPNDATYSALYGRSALKGF